MSSVAGTTAQDRDVRLPKATRVKNKQPADKQITAEQILRESKALQLEQDFKPPKLIITDPEELAEYRLKKRKEFEDKVRRAGRFDLKIWVNYATWEEQQKDFRRARSVWERALQISYRNVSFWLKYAEMEMRHRFINHARNVWDRAVTLLPRIDQLWYKYIHMEEMLGNVAGARQVFERWMSFEPDHQGWMAYIKMELRYNEVERARFIFERYVKCLPTVKAWVRFAKFEMKSGDASKARACYERAVQELGEDGFTEELYLRFAEFEEHVKEFDRARAIYQYALDHVPKAQAQDLFQRFVAFEKQHGSRDGIEDVINSKRRFQYEEEVQRDPRNYDTWFDYIRLEESAGEVDRIREVYERAIANVPPAPEKRYWQRYIYMWINYALFEELSAEDMERAREVYRTCLKLIPHKSFTFSKIWVLAANFEVRQKRLEAARKIYGMAIGMAPKAKIFKSYIELELSLGNVERVRTIYEKFLDWNPSLCTAWIKYAELEHSLDELERARAIFELAISQPVLDMPEALWKAYIDFEVSEDDRERARQLYERLLERTQHVKVWLSYARFEGTPTELLNAADDEDGDEAARSERQRAVYEAESREAAADRVTKARSVYERAFRALREGQPDAKEEAVMLLEAWRTFESSILFRSDEERARAIEVVEQRMPKRVKRRRPILTDDGLEAGMEEYYDYIFPDQAGNAPQLKLLEAAMRWKRQKTENDADA